MLLNNIRNLIHISEAVHWGHVLGGGALFGGGATAGTVGANALSNHLHEKAINIKDLNNTIEKKDLQIDTATKVAAGAAALGIAGKLAKRRSRNDDA